MSKEIVVGIVSLITIERQSSKILPICIQIPAI